MTRVLWLAVLVCVVQCLPMSQDELEDFSNFLLKTSSLDLHVKSADPDDSYDEDEVVSDHAWEESGKFEGDLILNDRQRKLIVENVEGLSRNGLTDSTKRWPNNEVIYFIQKEHFTGGQVQAIQDGIDDLAQASCVKFRPYRKGDRDAVVIQGSRRGCFSQVGYQGGYQVLNLSGRHPVGRGCFRHGTVVHELLHSLGFYHMQSSPDRDDYIDVIWANIIQPARHNFRKYNSFSVSDFGVGYDYDSVLHYSRRAFSTNGQDTLVPKKGGAEIGQRVGLSDKDTQKLNKMYCDADNDHIQADENTTKKPKNKKKKPKNEPFEGHGIGYHQGKTVVIKLPAAQTYKLPNVPSTHVFDFSKTSEVVPPEAAVYRFGKEITYPYKPLYSLNHETINDHQNNYEDELIPYKNIEKLPEDQAMDDKVKPIKEDKDERSSAKTSNESNEVKPEYVPIDEYDKDLAEAFRRLTKIVKQHVYPQNSGYIHKINKDYSKFYSPSRSQQSDPYQDSLDKKFERPILYDRELTFQKQKDSTGGKVPDDGVINNQFEDRMDTSYGVSLPTKKPYSSYEHTETPNYATLEYLRNRHDYSNLYSPETHDESKHNDDDNTSKAESDTYEQDIKINPYGQVFYTDYVKDDRKSNIKDDDSKVTNASIELKSGKYELAQRIPNKQAGLTNQHFKDNMESSFKINLPTKKPYSAYEQSENPKYATLEYLKDRHDISNMYTVKSSDDERRKKSYAVTEDELPLTESDWYKKDSFKHNPANYGENSYSDYVQQHRKDHKNTDRLTNASKYNDGESSRESPNKYKVKYKTDNDDKIFYTDYEKENNEHITENQRNDSEEEYNPEEYYSNTRKKLNGRVTYPNKNVSKNNTDTSKSDTNEPLNYNPDFYYTDYEEDLNDQPLGAKISENSDESPKKSQAYTLYGAPVPLTRDWFKPSYTIPEISKEDVNFRSLNDHR